MSTRQVLEDILIEGGAFTEEIHPLVHKIVDIIPGNIPYHLRLAIALNELVVLISHLRKNIKLFNGTLVPMNMITFALAKSGLSKDASMQTVRRAFREAYDMIEEYRKDLAKERAENAAILEGKKKEEWLKYYKKPKPLQAGLGTVEGLVQHFADLEKGEIGAGYIMANEIGQELLTNGNMSDIIKAVSVGYDLGYIPAKIVKSAENQTDGVENLPISALFFGSEDAILLDNTVKNKFNMVFTTQLARRSIFSFSPEIPSKPEFGSLEEMRKIKAEERERSAKAQEEVRKVIKDIIVDTESDPIPLSQDAQDLFDAFLEYNLYLSDDISAKYPIAKLARKHKQWLALKLSGTYAILDGNVEISGTNYIQALNTVEIFSDDLSRFEKELVKEPYEVFSEFCQFAAEDGKYFINLHELKKLGYITGKSNSMSAMKELSKLASSYDKNGIYSLQEDGINYELPEKTEVVGISYKDVSGTKEQRAKQASKGLEYYETDFSELNELLNGDYAYNPFKFKGGVRNNDNIEKGCKFLVLDIDESDISDVECHLMLSEINHHIARTSNKDNAFKFRVLVEVDQVVDIPGKQWTMFMREVANTLGLTADILPKSQIYFAWSDREVYSVADSKPLEIKELLIKSANALVVKEDKTPNLTKPQAKSLLDNPMGTFRSFEALPGHRSTGLVRDALYALSLGADMDYVDKLIDDIAEYWVDPLTTNEIENIKVYIKRRYDNGRY